MSEADEKVNTKVIVCLTGFSKAEVETLSQIIGNLGCVFESSLTTRTTHLVCATTNSTKYACAQTAGIICVTREWLDVSQAEGHPVAEVCPFIVPPLYGCILCPTGLSKSERAVVERDCVALGARFSVDLTSYVTHLVAKCETNSRKYLFASQRHMAIVTPEWVLKAAQTHTHPPESKYAVGSPKPPGESCSPTLEASQAAMSSADPVDKVKKDDKDSKADDALKPLKGCQVAFYGFTTEQRSPLKRLLAELGAGKSVPLDCPTATHVVVSLNPDNPRIDYDNPPFVRTAAVVEPRWLVACYQVHSRLNEALFHPMQALPPAPLIQTGTSSGTSTPSFMERPMPCAFSSRRLTQSLEKTLFSGLSFAIYGFDEDATERYKDLVCSHNGSYYDCGKECPNDPEQEANVNYIVMPHGFPMEERTKLKQERFLTAQPVSIDWLELCERMSIVLDLSRSPVLTPLKFPTPFETMVDVVISFSGFGSQDRLLHTTFAHRLGASVTTTFARRANTHLIAACPTGNKYKAACKWGIPVVSVSWLRQCAQVGECAPTRLFLLSGTQDSASDASATAAGTRMPRSKSGMIQPSSLPHYWKSFNQSSKDLLRQHRKSQPEGADPSQSSAAAEFAPPDTLQPSISGTSSTSTASYLGYAKGATCGPVPRQDKAGHIATDGPCDPMAVNDIPGIPHDRQQPATHLMPVVRNHKKKKNMAKLDMSVGPLDDSDLERDTLELPAAQMPLIFQPTLQHHPPPSKQEGVENSEDEEDAPGGDDGHLRTPSESIGTDRGQKWTAASKRHNRESNPECVVSYERKRVHDMNKQ